MFGFDVIYQEQPDVLDDSIMATLAGITSLGNDEENNYGYGVINRCAGVNDTIEGIISNPYCNSVIENNFSNMNDANLYTNDMIGKVQIHTTDVSGNNNEDILHNLQLGNEIEFTQLETGAYLKGRVLNTKIYPTNSWKPTIYFEVLQGEGTVNDDTETQINFSGESTSNIIVNVTEAELPTSPKYWKKIIPENYSIYNRDGLVDGQYINTHSEQNWLNDYYYPVLPKYGANGKFIEGDYPNDNIPFPMEGPITDDDYSDENLKISINNENVDLNVFDDNSGNNNYGFVFNDYKPRFNKETLQPEKTKNMSRIKTSTNNGAF